MMTPITKTTPDYPFPNSRHWPSGDFPAASAGLTLIELVATVAIIGILAQLAYPSYINYIIRANRSAAQQALLDIANRQEQYLLNSRSYGTLTQLNVTLPQQVSKYYQVTVTPNNDATPPTFTITAAPIATTTQAKDGSLTLDSSGTKTPAAKW